VGVHLYFGICQDYADLGEVAPLSSFSAPLFRAGDEPIPGCSRLIGRVDPIRNGPLPWLATIARECLGISRYIHVVETDGRRFQHHRPSRA